MDSTCFQFKTPRDLIISITCDGSPWFQKILNNLPSLIPPLDFANVIILRCCLAEDSKEMYEL